MSGFLSPYRVLDLSDERGLLAGHMFAQLGADVIQIEPLAGSPARAVGPLAADAPAGDNSFYWSAYAAGKRSVALDLDSSAGRDVLQRLIRSADFLIESADTQQRERWGITPAATAALNSALIHVSISAFGSSGPKADYAASDLTIWAAGGPLLPSRDTTRSPLRISAPQSWLNAAADGAGGALIAHFARLQSGRGQHVDVSAQQSAALCTMSASLAVPLGHPNYTIPGAITPAKKTDGKKDLDLSGSGSRTRRSKWQVKDGMVEMHIGIGPAGGRFSNNLFKWLVAEKACDADIAQWDFITVPQRILADEITEADMERARDNVARFFARFTKNELLEQAMTRRFLCAPIATTQDLLTSKQLAAREFYVTVTEGSGAQRQLPGNFAVVVSDDPALTGFAALTPAPTLGEHTQLVLRDWLALNPAAIEQLRAQGAIA
jgi:crotonobetainyl-CoA:carnitine CoA-transferase CaiB-like acyl-CoA transferase